MSEIQKEYVLLFNAISDVSELLEAVSAYLKAVQQAAEEIYISRGE